MIDTSCRVCGIRYGDASGFAIGDWRYRHCPSCRGWAKGFRVYPERPGISPEAARRILQGYRASFPAVADAAVRQTFREFDEALEFDGRKEWARPGYVPDWAESKERYQK